MGGDDRVVNHDSQCNYDCFGKGLRDSDEIRVSMVPPTEMHAGCGGFVYSLEMCGIPGNKV